MNRKISRLLSLFIIVAMAVTGGAVTAAAGQPSGASPASGASPVSKKEVYLGGMPFGVKFFTDGVMVVGFCDLDGEGNVNPARDAGLQIKDIITAIGGTPIGGAADLTAAVEGSNGQAMALTVKRKKTGSKRGGLQS